MFDKNELDQIEQVVGKVIVEKVPPIVREIVQEEISSVMEHQIMPQFDLLHQRIDEVAGDVTVLKDDVSHLRRDIAVIKQQPGAKGWVDRTFSPAPRSA